MSEVPLYMYRNPGGGAVSYEGGTHVPELSHLLQDRPHHPTSSPLETGILEEYADL
jgi:hypothetical protein